PNNSMDVRAKQRLYYQRRPLNFTLSLAVSPRLISIVVPLLLRPYDLMIRAELIAKHWLTRGFEVTTHEGLFYVVYYGQGSGFEQVVVNNQVVCKKKTVWWYAPEFEFSVGSLPATIKIRVWVWLAIRSFSLDIDGKRVYFEGKE
ncbi:MAG TPA: hypothetical protein VK308_11610, partial [Pyrinomonadaceae bacterium]|nr:hypothetical protein [Pyrinomonadaceae bacterium]